VLSGSAAISIRGLTKRYGRLIAVDHLDLEVPRGEVFGFLGLNGAGKTTTIRILLDLLRPTSGSVAVFGHDCQSDSLKARSAVFARRNGNLFRFDRTRNAVVLRANRGQKRFH
jgi:ABC-2 type transport system ATP-binding protein